MGLAGQSESFTHFGGFEVVQASTRLDLRIIAPSAGSILFYFIIWKGGPPSLDLSHELGRKPRHHNHLVVNQIHPESVHVTAVLVQYTTPTGRINNGVATSWLAQKKPQADQEVMHRVPIFIRKSQFR